MSFAEEHVADTETIPPELSFLKGLEELVRCPICFDYLQAPVLLPGCDHNYCSLCVRKYLTQKEQCPTCGSPASSNQLRSNYVLAKVIQQYKQVLDPLKTVCQRSTKHQASLPADQLRDNVEAKKRKVRHTSPPPVPKPKSTRTSCKENTQITAQKASLDTSSLSSQSDHDSDDSDVQVVSESSPSGSCGERSGKTGFHSSPSFFGSPKKTVQSKIFSHLSGSATRSRSPDGVDKNKSNSNSKENLSQGRTLNFSPRMTSPLVSSQVRNSESSTSSKQSPVLLRSPDQMSKLAGSLQNSAPSLKTQQSVPVGSASGSSPGGNKVPCPVCDILVMSHAVNRHLDLCLASKDKQFSRSQKLSEKRKLMPKLVYNLLSDKDIRKRLKQLGLNTQGDRQVMIKRHHEFTLYYNADCDSFSPKDMKDMLMEFEETQKMQKKLSSRPSDSQSILRFTKESSKEDIEQANKEYVSKHQKQFKDLVKQARNRMKAARKAHTPSDTATNTPGHATNTSPGKCFIAETSSTENSQESYSSVNSQQSCCPVDENSGKSSRGAMESGECITLSDYSQDLTIIPCSPVVSCSFSVSCSISDDSGDDGSKDVLNPGNSETTLKSGKSLKGSDCSKKSAAKRYPHSVPSDVSGALSDIERDSAEDTGSDVFEYDHEFLSVFAMKRSKRALRPNKPNWTETGFFEAEDNDSDLTSYHSQSSCLSDSSLQRSTSSSLPKSSVEESKGSDVCDDVLQSDSLQSSSSPVITVPKELLCTNLADGDVSKKCTPSSEILPGKSDRIMPAEPLLHCDQEEEQLSKPSMDINGPKSDKAKCRKVNCLSVTDVESLPQRHVECKTVSTEHSETLDPLQVSIKQPTSREKGKPKMSDTGVRKEESATSTSGANAVDFVEDCSEVSLSITEEDGATLLSHSEHQLRVVVQDATLSHQEHKATTITVTNTTDTLKKKKCKNPKTVAQEDPEIFQNKAEGFELCKFELSSDNAECTAVHTDSSGCIEVDSTNDSTESLEPNSDTSAKLKSLLKKKRKSAKFKQLLKSVRFTGLKPRVSDVMLLSEQNASSSSSKNSNREVAEEDAVGDSLEDEMKKGRENDLALETCSIAEHSSNDRDHHSKAHETEGHNVKKGKIMKKTKNKSECNIGDDNSHHSLQNGEDETCHSRECSSKAKNKLSKDGNPKVKDQHKKQKDKPKDHSDKTDKPRKRKKQNIRRKQTSKSFGEETNDILSTQSSSKTGVTSELPTAVSPTSMQGMQGYQAFTEEKLDLQSQAVTPQNLTDTQHRSNKRKMNITHKDNTIRRKTSARTKEGKHKKRKDNQDSDSDEDFSPTKNKLTSTKRAQSEDAESSSFLPGKDEVAWPVTMKKRNRCSKKRNYTEVEEHEPFSNDSSNDYVEEIMSAADIVKTRGRKRRAKHSSSAPLN